MTPHCVVFEVEYQPRVYSPAAAGKTLVRGIQARAKTKTRLSTIAEQEIVLPGQFSPVLPQYSSLFLYEISFISYHSSARGIRRNTIPWGILYFRSLPVYK